MVTNDAFKAVTALFTATTSAFAMSALFTSIVFALVFKVVLIVFIELATLAPFAFNARAALTSVVFAFNASAVVTSAATARADKS